MRIPKDIQRIKDFVQQEKITQAFMQEMVGEIRYVLPNTGQLKLQVYSRNLYLEENDK